jgi:hypothetical protein
MPPRTFLSPPPGRGAPLRSGVSGGICSPVSTADHKASSRSDTRDHCLRSRDSSLSECKYPGTASTHRSHPGPSKSRVRIRPFHRILCMPPARARANIPGPCPGGVPGKANTDYPRNSGCFRAHRTSDRPPSWHAPAPKSPTHPLRNPSLRRPLNLCPDCKKEASPLSMPRTKLSCVGTFGNTSCPTTTQ